MIVHLASDSCEFRANHVSIKFPIMDAPYSLAAKTPPTLLRNQVLSLTGFSSYIQKHIFRMLRFELCTRLGFCNKNLF